MILRPFAAKYKRKIGRTVGKESCGESTTVFKKEIIALARNEVHESMRFSDRDLWVKIKSEYFKL